MTNIKTDISAPIKMILKERKLTQKRLSLLINEHPVVVNDVIHMRRPNVRVRSAISKVVGIPISTLWPEMPDVSTAVSSGPSNKKKCPARDSGEISPVGDVLGSPDPNSGRSIFPDNFSHNGSMPSIEE